MVSSHFYQALTGGITDYDYNNVRRWLTVEHIGFDIFDVEHLVRDVYLTNKSFVY